jgi:predicted lipid carrier protein YhbT
MAALPPLLSAALRPLPLAPLQPALAVLLRAVVRRHPRIFDRLGEHAEKRFGLDPTDLPFALLLEPRPRAPRITALRRLPARGLDARIAGPIRGLVGMADGSLDGDALFFSRDLVVEGDMAAVVALRNAIEGAGVDLIGDAAATLGPFGPPAERLLRGGIGLLERLAPPSPARPEPHPWN